MIRYWLISVLLTKAERDVLSVAILGELTSLSKSIVNDKIEGAREDFDVLLNLQQITWSIETKRLDNLIFSIKILAWRIFKKP